MSKEYFIEILQQNGFTEQEIKGIAKLPEETIEKMAMKFAPKKRGRKIETANNDEIISKLKDPKFATKSNITFELFSGKGRKNSEGTIKGTFKGFKLYAVIEYTNPATGSIEKKELDAFKL